VVDRGARDARRSDGHGRRGNKVDELLAEEAPHVHQRARPRLLRLAEGRHAEPVMGRFTADSLPSHLDASHHCMPLVAGKQLQRFEVRCLATSPAPRRPRASAPGAGRWR
jgi:hypothetical protein